MAHQGIPADLRQGDGNELAVQLHTAGFGPCRAHLLHEAAGVADLQLGVGVLLVEHLVKFVPEGVYGVAVGLRQLPVDRVGVELAELVDVVALAGVVPPGEGGEGFAGVEVVLPEAVAVHGGVGIPLHQALPLVLRHHAEGGRYALLHAPLVDVVQGGVHVPLAGEGDGEVKHGPIVGAVVEDHQAAVALGKLGFPVVLPHELDPQGVFAQAVGALTVIFSQQGGVLFINRGELQHKDFALFL